MIPSLKFTIKTLLIVVVFTYIKNNTTWLDFLNGNS